MCQLHSSKDIDDQNHNLDLDLPIKKRQCTDVLCCVLFFICLTLLGALAVFSFAMGDYRRIIFPKDSQGKICGLDYPNQGRLFFFDMASCLDISDVVIALGCPTTKVCVSSCPTYRLTQPYNDDQNFRELVICEGGVSGNAEAYAHKPINDLCNSGKCACEITPTESILGRCFPKNLFPVLQNRTERVLADPKAEKPPPSLTALVFGARTLVTEMLEDLIRTWKVIIVCLFLAAFASFLWIVLLRLCTCVMVYFTLLVFTALFALATGFCFWRYAVTKKLASQPPPFYLTLDITILFRYSTTWLILGKWSIKYWNFHIQLGRGEGRGGGGGMVEPQRHSF
nr:choline transporter protein 2 [Hymenolepis microstoma]